MMRRLQTSGEYANLRRQRSCEHFWVATPEGPPSRLHAGLAPPPGACPPGSAAARSGPNPHREVGMVQNYILFL